jgi:hypothetical protein
MVCLEYMLKPTSKKWQVSQRRHTVGRDLMEQESPALAAQQGWASWRIVDEYIGDEVKPKTPPPAKYRSELTEAGEQLVIPDCELDAPQTGAKQGSLF